METVVPLVRAVVRAFYTDEHAIVVEPLLRDPYYLEDDNQAKGALSRKFGWIASKIIRQRLAALVEHSLVQKKEIMVTINLETGDSDMSRHKRDFYYIDFVHFVKVITLRMHMVPQFIFQSKREAVKPEWTCFPDCNQGKVFSLLDVVQLRTNARTGCFCCPTCGSDLEEREPVLAAANAADSYEGVDEKFKQQILGETDFRDGIREYMTQAQHTGNDLPDNDPAKKFKKLELESKRLKLMSQQAEGAQEEEDDHRKAATIAAADKLMPSWFKTNAKGELTEDAIQDDKQRKLRNQSARADEQQGPDDYVQSYQQEMMAQVVQAAPPDAAVSEERSQEDVRYPVFTFKSGRQVERRPDMTQDEFNALAEACPEDEYESFVTFFET